MNKILEFIKSEAVFCISALLAVISCFFVAPSPEYIGYMDFRTLALLLALMTVMAGFSKCGVFEYLARALLGRAKTLRGVCASLVLLCFFTSMLITNDVALITFVPFAIAALREADRRDKIMSVVILQTVAANLGSMLTPIGNPQNLYLYSLSGMTAAQLVKTMLPYTALSFALLFIFIIPVKKSAVKCAATNVPPPDKKSAAAYTVLLSVCMLTVAGGLHYGVSLAAVLLFALLFDRSALKAVDYSLIATFVCFFVFIGNIKNIGALHSLLERVISGNEFPAAVISSQIISNVPAAALLSGFTSEYADIMKGANIGGLGTIIASMASLISYKYFANLIPEQKGRYILRFTAVNLIFLAALTSAYYMASTVFE